jgi:RimJ/RimL family protein N-acetyltransferase
MIQTARLTLRPPTLADARAIFETYAGVPEATHFMGWPRHQDLAATEGFLRFALDEWAQHGSGTFLIELDGTLIGSTGCHVDAPGVVGTGYILGRPWWGRGYATEACRAMVARGRDLGAHRMESYCHADHAASARVLEKSGLSLEARLPDHIVFPNYAPALQDALIYALAY